MSAAVQVSLRSGANVRVFRFLDRATGHERLLLATDGVTIGLPASLLDGIVAAAELATVPGEAVAVVEIAAQAAAG